MYESLRHDLNGIYQGKTESLHEVISSKMLCAKLGSLFFTLHCTLLKAAELMIFVDAVATSQFSYNRLDYIDEILKDDDSNRDGYITYEEFTHLRRQERAMENERIARREPKHSS